MTQRLTIQQVSASTNLSQHTLRYYEKIGLILGVGRANSGHRRYQEEDLEWINFLKQLKATGMPLTEMQAFAKLRRMGPQTAKQRRQMLEAHRKKVLAQIAELSSCIDVIDSKIERHRKSESEQIEKENHDRGKQPKSGQTLKSE